MATVDITLGSVQGRGAHGGTMPVYGSSEVDSDTITSSGTSQQSDFSVPAGGGPLVWCITVTGGNVRVKFGSNPTAVAAEAGGWLILDGQTRDFAATAGDKVAVIDA